MMSYALENHKTVFKIMNLKTIIVTCLRDPFFEIREDESPELFSHKKPQSLHYQDTSVIYSSDFGRCVFWRKYQTLWGPFASGRCISISLPIAWWKEDWECSVQGVVEVCRQSGWGGGTVEQVGRTLGLCRWGSSHWSYQRQSNLHALKPGQLRVQLQHVGCNTRLVQQLPAPCLQKAALEACHKAQSHPQPKAMEQLSQCASLLISVVTKKRRYTHKEQRMVHVREMRMRKPSKKEWMCFIKSWDKFKELTKRKGIYKDGEVGRNEQVAIKKKKKPKKILETLIRIQHRLKCSARGSYIYCMKHPQGIAQH